MTEITFTDQRSAAPSQAPTITTGPSGLVLGRGPAGPVALRLFRPQPTRVFVAVPEYLLWLVSFRAVCLGAHLSVIAADHRRWLTLADTVRACGGTIDVLHDADQLPGRGRAFRPSLIVDEVASVPATRRLGAWQSLLAVGDPSRSSAVAELRACDVALLAPLPALAAEHLRRAYALTSGQLSAVANLDESDVVLATVRRATRVKAPPSPTEYRLLFGA